MRYFQVLIGLLAMQLMAVAGHGQLGIPPATPTPPTTPPVGSQTAIPPSLSALPQLRQAHEQAGAEIGAAESAVTPEEAPQEPATDQRAAENEAIASRKSISTGDDKPLSRIEKIYSKFYWDIGKMPVEKYDFRLWGEEFQKAVQQDAEKDRQPLRQFGYEFFQSEIRTETFAVPDGGYVIGPGDQLLIRAWGAGVDFEVKAMVSPEGTISLPSLGVLSVAGLKSADIEKAINTEAQKYVPGVNLHVTLAALKSLEIYIAGNVARPGLHLVPAFSTIVTALSKYGPPTKDGSLRHIKLLRGNQEVAELDVYDILLRGDKTSDEYVESGDLIFVPNIGMTVAVGGLVRKEAIFELRGEKSWHDVLKLAGGLLPQAENTSLLLKRFVDNRIQIVDKIALEDVHRPERAFAVRDGDYLLVPAPLLEGAIRISGHVFRPGIIKHTKGMTLHDVLQSPERLAAEDILIKPGAIMDHGLLRRFDPASGYFRVKRFPLGEVLRGGYNETLEEYDEIVILAKDDYAIREMVHIEGAVWKPGAYPFSPGMGLGTLVAMAGGLKDGAVLTEVELNRQQVVDNKIVTMRHLVDYHEIASGGADMVLQKNDHVSFKEVKDHGRHEYAEISGEVAFPGRYSLGRGDRVADLIRRAGGYLDNAYLYGAKFTRDSARQVKRMAYDQLIQKLEVDVSRANADIAKVESEKKDESVRAIIDAQQRFLDRLKKVEVDGRIVVQLSSLPSLAGSEYDFLLEPNDALDIPKKPDFVSVLGSVYNTNSYFYNPGLDVGDYLLKSGGTTPDADKKHIYVAKANGEIVSRHTSGRFLVNSFDNMTLMPGDTIVVPEDFDRVPWMKMVQDISDILFKLATTAGVVIAVAD